jgi:hypothetical protein
VADVALDGVSYENPKGEDLSYDLGGQGLEIEEESKIAPAEIIVADEVANNGVSKQQEGKAKELNLKRPVRKWQRRWVLQPNVIELGGEIWIQKWICVENLNTVTIAPTVVQP